MQETKFVYQVEGITGRRDLTSGEIESATRFVWQDAYANGMGDDLIAGLRRRHQPCAIHAGSIRITPRKRLCLACARPVRQ